MASVKIIEDSKRKAKSFKAIDYGIINVGKRGWTSVIVEEDIPFRVRFTNIQIPGYGPNNIPGIGVQVIGYSNYIL
jgi:hypothetical protein